MTTRPAPRPTDDSAVYWDAVARHELVAQRCERAEGCATRRGPCARIAGASTGTSERLAGTGSLYSYAVLHHPQSPMFDYPVLAALVDLDEGVRIVTNLVGIEPADIRIGMRVNVDFEPTSDGGTVPVFRPTARRRSA